MNICKIKAYCIACICLYAYSEETVCIIDNEQNSPRIGDILLVITEIGCHLAQQIFEKKLL
jgi:hypothetical protein